MRGFLKLEVVGIVEREEYYFSLSTPHFYIHHVYTDYFEKHFIIMS